MNKQLEVDLLNKLPKNGKIVIIGATEVANKIYNDIRQYRPDIKIIGFIECKKKISSLNNLPVWNLKEFIDKNIQIDYAVWSTLIDTQPVSSILDVYDIPVLTQSAYLYHYYRNNLDLFNDENYETIISMFDEKEDKELFDLIFKLRACILPWSKAEKYYSSKYSNSKVCIYNNIKYHYLDKINKNAVTTILDAGLFDGLYILAFNKLLPNLKKTIGFEVIYNLARKNYIEDFVLNNRLEIVPFALGEKESTTTFYININNFAASFGEDISSYKNYSLDNKEKIVVPITTIDKYCKQHKIYPNFIKMDIEGAELSALKGGIEYIKEQRPQMAISIYHSNEDFFNIPIYLKNNLNNYKYHIGHYTGGSAETVLYAIPDELA